MFKIYLLLENLTDPNSENKFKSIIYNIFIPIFLLLEYIIYLYYWKNIVIRELLTSDEIVSFLDKQEFEYNGKVIKKMDLLSENEFFDRIDSKDAKEIIKKEYVLTISNLLEKNIPINIEDYINLNINVEIKTVKKDDEFYRDRIYSVIIQFCRQYYLTKAFKIFKNWLIIVLGLIILGSIGYYYLNQLI